MIHPAQQQMMGQAGTGGMMTTPNPVPHDPVRDPCRFSV